MEDKLAIIVPFRDRQKHLDIFVPHIHEFLKGKGIDYTIFIAEQTDDRPFNYGKLCNVVVNEIGEEYTYFAFHDIDMLPMNDDCDYSYPDVPIHLASQVQAHEYKLPYPQYFGGVVLINREDFEEANGYSNEYWGYGFEDLDLLFRIKESGGHVEKFYDLNKVYSNQNTTDILPYRIENVRISNNDKSHLLKIVEFPKESYAHGILNPLMKESIQKSFSISLWFNDSGEYEDIKKLFYFKGLDTGIFLNNSTQLMVQLWDSAEKSYGVTTDYYRNQWNHVVFGIDLKNNLISLNLNGVTTINDIPSDFKIHPYYHNLIVSDDVSQIQLASVMMFDRILSEDDISELYYNGYESLNYLETQFGIKPIMNLDFGNQDENFNYPSHSYKKIVLDNGSNFNHLKIQNDVITKNQVISVTDPIYLPVRYSGKYNTLTHSRDTDVIGRYYEYNPDVMENADIFFYDILTKDVDWREIGLNSLDYNLVKETNEELNYESFKIIT